MGAKDTGTREALIMRDKRMSWLAPVPLSTRSASIPKFRELSLRIDGEGFEDVRLRYSMEDGVPFGPIQVIIWNPVVGLFTLSDDYHIELKEDGCNWQKVTLCYLITILQSYGTGT